MYIASEKTLDNGQKLPENRCFCGSPSDESCVPAGAMNVSKCKYGAPAFVSLPHFYRADPYYIKNIDMPPANPIEDDLFIALEPVINFGSKPNGAIIFFFLENGTAPGS